VLSIRKTILSFTLLPVEGTPLDVDIVRENSKEIRVTAFEFKVTVKIKNKKK